MPNTTNKIKEIVGTVAPALGMALGGPIGGIAGAVVREALGVDSDEKALELLTTDPESLVKLRTAEQEFQVKLRELDIDEQRIAAADRASARGLAEKRGTEFQSWLTIVFMVGYFLLIYLFFTGGLNVGSLGEWGKGQLGILIGVLTAAVPQILSYWFGSSEGSKRKTQVLAHEVANGD